MNDEPDEQRERGRRWACTAFFLFVPVLYVLSIGPAYWLSIQFVLAGYVNLGDAVCCLYEPVMWASQYTGTGNWLHEYVWWWMMT